jgi:hypothetical protein
MADPKTGVIMARALNINKFVIDMNGIKTLLLLSPGLDRALLVVSRFTTLIVVLIPA